ncbi:MAG: hypothetical protein WBO24_18570 [Nitrospirales bacterium]
MAKGKGFQLKWPSHILILDGYLLGEFGFKADGATHVHVQMILSIITQINLALEIGFQGVRCHVGLLFISSIHTLPPLMDEVSQAMLIKAIWAALERFHGQDSDLFRGKHVKEECVNHRVALHVQEALLMGTCEELNDLRQEIISAHVKIDVEYDKALDQGKIIGGEPSRPDLLIHHRGDNSNNYAFIELKKRYRTPRDIEKCKGAKKSPYDYKQVLIIECLRNPPCKMRIIEMLAADGTFRAHKYPSVTEPSRDG